MTPTDNPFSAPSTQSLDAGAAIGSEAEVIRRAHLGAEAGLRSVSSIFFVFGAVAVLWAGTLLIVGIRLDARASELVWATATILVGSAFGFTAIELRRFQARSRWPAFVLCLVSLAIFPIGTVVGIYGAILLLSPKGHTVLSERYSEIRRQTPQLRIRTPMSVWLVLASLVVVVAIALALLHF